jgi:hypothetical protein
MFPRTITFETPADLRAKYLQQLESRNAEDQLLSSMFNAAGNLTIRSRPQQYKLINEEWGKITDAFSSVWYETSIVRTQGFELEITDQRAEIRFLLWEVALRQRAIVGQVQTIWVDDAIGFDPIKDYATGVTRKRGILYLQPVSGVISNGQLLCPTVGAGGNGQAVEVPTPIVRYYTEPYSVRFVTKDLDAIV